MEDPGNASLRTHDVNLLTLYFFASSYRIEAGVFLIPLCIASDSLETHSIFSHIVPHGSNCRRYQRCPSGCQDHGRHDVRSRCNHQEERFSRSGFIQAVDYLFPLQLSYMIVCFASLPISNASMRRQLAIVIGSTELHRIVSNQ